MKSVVLSGKKALCFKQFFKNYHRTTFEKYFTPLYLSLKNVRKVADIYIRDLYDNNTFFML